MQSPKTKKIACIILEILQLGAALLTLSIYTQLLAFLLFPITILCIAYKYK